MTTIVVLGMHRSGTSFVTRALHEAGMYLGPNLLNHPASDNLEGHWEPWELVGINDAILEASGATWDNIQPDFTPVALAGIETRIRSFLAELGKQPVSGFKDPRTLLTFPIWKPHLTGLHFVACLRHPDNVAKSLCRRHGDWSHERGLQLWVQYNSRLLQYTAEVGPERVFWFDFDADQESAEAMLNRWMTPLGLQPAASQYNPFLKHHAELPKIADPHVAGLYQAIRERVAAQQERMLIATPAAETAPDIQAATLEIRLNQLATAHNHHDDVIQRQQSSLAELDQRAHQIRGETAGQVERLEYQLRQDNEAWRTELEVLNQRLAAMTQSAQLLAEQLTDQNIMHALICRQLQDRITLLEQRRLKQRIIRSAKAIASWAKHGFSPRNRSSLPAGT